MIGTLFGNYRITHKIGAGGQGTVYKATDQKLGRTVVIKVLPAELTVKENNLKRFEREARLASALDHPNICTIFDMDETNGLHYIAMQYVEGKNVRQLCNGRPLELDSALRIGIQTADALSAAHARGFAVPDQLAITGWDGSSAAVAAGLTTVEQSLYDQGRNLTLAVLGLADSVPEPAWSLVRRGSTRDLP